MNFQDAIKETSEQIKIRLKDKQISSLLTDVIGASFAANVIQLASPVSGEGSEVNSSWSCTRPFSPPTQYTEKKRSGHARGNAATLFCKRLANLLSAKHSLSYGIVMGWLRCKLSFSLLRSAIMCIRGARSSLRCPVAEAPIAVQVAEAHI